ncbi:craniofacial development protein 2-like [Elysia marginata]|uniref:Craniofacial development protein 2-like n=1 Tax=Elysia marginata TaxID=1093978 RepID=A0AAV4FIW6_9GAST|nr:craniofacial development protein 2-like [Elysia marginata]
MLQKGKLDNIKREMGRLKINIMGISEVRWKGAGVINSDSHKLIYSGGNDHDRGVGFILDRQTSLSLKGYWAVSDRVILIKLEGKPLDLDIIQIYAPTSTSTEEDMDAFYLDLEKTKKQCKSQDLVIIMGDFNPKVKQRMDDVVGRHGLGQKNERGERLVEWAQRNEVIVGNTWFEQLPRRKWTWKSPGDGSRNQIDFILISKRFRNALLISKTLPSADCYSDHVLLMGKIRVKLRKQKKTKPNIRLNLDLLTSDTDLYQKYNLKVKNKFEAFEEIEEVEELWQQLKRSTTEAAEEEIPTKERKTKQKWMTEDIPNLMDKRRKAKGEQEEYESIHREVRRKCEEAKEAWLNEKCREIDTF